MGINIKKVNIQTLNNIIEDYQNGKSIIGFILPTDITFSLSKQKHLPE